MEREGWRTDLENWLRPSISLLIVVAGGALVLLLAPGNWWGGFMLFVAGMWAGQWEEQINPRPRPEEPLPTPPWDDMDAAEKRAYALPPLVYGAFSILFLAGSFQFDFRAFGWGLLAVGLYAGAAAIWSGRRRWQGRFGT